MSTCTDTTTCFPCNQGNSCEEGCIIENFDACCVQYKGETLPNIPIETGDTLCEILEKLDEYSFSETTFLANTTNTIVAAPNGVKGHSPFYHVKLDPVSNAITSGPSGIKVPIPDGKIKTTITDSLDFLGTKLLCGSQLDEAGNTIVSVCPTIVNNKIYLVPNINKLNLLNWIKEDLCNVVSDCIPVAGTTTTTTSSSTSTTTSSSSSSSTSTTTQSSRNFVVTNYANQGAFTVVLKDSVSNIDYHNVNSLNNSVTNLTYSGSTNQSSLIIQHNSNVPVRIIVSVNSISVYDSQIYIGSVTIPNIGSRTNVEVTLIPYAGTTTTSTSTSSSTSTSTTTQGCVTVEVNNPTGSSKLIEFIDCFGYPSTLNISPETTVSICLINGTLVVPPGVGSLVMQEGCVMPTTTTTTTVAPTTTTTTTIAVLTKVVCQGDGCTNSCGDCPVQSTVYHTGVFGQGTTLYSNAGLTTLFNPGGVYPNVSFGGNCYSVTNGVLTLVSSCPTTTTSSTSTTTTTQPCYTYTIESAGSIPGTVAFTYIDCTGASQNQSMGANDSATVCARPGTVDLIPPYSNTTITQVATICN
jgi:hypothetical protein